MSDHFRAFHRRGSRQPSLAAVLRQSALIWLLAPLLAAAPDPSAAAQLALRLRDAGSGLPTAARVVLTGVSGELLAVPDPMLRTHTSGVLGNFAHVEDSLVVEVPLGLVQVFAVRGITGIPATQVLVVDDDVELTLLLSDWIDPPALGWFGGDPHVHSNHEGGGEYPAASLEDAARAARAEGLELMVLLDNDVARPGGPVLPPLAGTTLVWGEEYRTGFWGHVVLLGLSSLVLTDGNPGCCGWRDAGWPTLTETLADPSIPVALLAHPHTTEDLDRSTVWPGAGHARELRALALGSGLEGVAAVGATNEPPWALEAYLDALRAGARWAALGEGDRPLDRFVVSPPGMPRTYARVDPPAAGDWEAGDPDLAAAWTAAIAAGHSFATTGPILHTVAVDGVGMGETLALGAPGPATVHLAFDSFGRIDALRVHGATGKHLEWTWPTGRAHLDTMVTLVLDHDDFVLVEIEGSGDDWPQLQLPPRAVASPVWVTTGNPWPVDVAMARRGADELREVWQISLDDRGYDSEADSAAAREDILGAADLYEAMADDPPPAFALLAPAPASVLATLQFVLQWEPVSSYDGEPVTYRITVATDAGFTDVVLQAVVSESSLIVSSLAAGERYVWKVEALEPGDPVTLASNAPWTFRIEDTAVDVPWSAPRRLALRSLGARGAGALFELALPRPSRPLLSVIDVRGRRVHTFPSSAREAGTHVLRWDGRDDHGRPVARGVYWLLARARAETAQAKVVLLR